MKKTLFDSLFIGEAREACNILMDFNRLLTTNNKEEIDLNAINKAREAAVIVNKTGYFHFDENNTSFTDFFNEVQKFANNFCND